MTTIKEDLPYDIDAEEATLGAALQSAESAALIVEALTSRHFYRPAHQVVFECITDLVERAAEVGPMSVKVELERRRKQGELVDPTTLFDMMAAIPVPGHVGVYVERLQDLHYRRELIHGGNQMRALGLRPGLDRVDTSDQAQKILDRITKVDVGSSIGTPVSELVQPFLDRLESKAPDVGVTTGWTDLDALVTKLRPGQLIVVGARPGVGKTVLMINLALHVGVTLRLPVLFLSLEMSKDEILTRMFAHQAGIGMHKLQQREMTDQEWARLAKTSADLAGIDNLIIDDDANTTPAHLQGKLAAMRRSGRPAAAVFVDYLQLMPGTRRIDNRQLEVSEISRTLKRLARDFEVPIIVGSQLNRESEKRADKRPLKSDLRESGSLENDGDMVILLHREDMYDKTTPRVGEIDIDVAKHRQGATATITAVFQGHYSRIADMSKRWA